MKLFTIISVASLASRCLAAPPPTNPKDNSGLEDLNNGQEETKTNDAAIIADLDRQKSRLEGMYKSISDRTDRLDTSYKQVTESFQAKMEKLITGSPGHQLEAQRKGDRDVGPALQKASERHLALFRKALDDLFDSKSNSDEHTQGLFPIGDAYETSWGHIAEMVQWLESVSKYEQTRSWDIKSQINAFASQIESTITNSVESTKEHFHYFVEVFLREITKLGDLTGNSVADTISRDQGENEPCPPEYETFVQVMTAILKGFDTVMEEIVAEMDRRKQADSISVLGINFHSLSEARKSLHKLYILMLRQKSQIAIHRKIFERENGEINSVFAKSKFAFGARDAKLGLTGYVETFRDLKEVLAYWRNSGLQRDKISTNPYKPLSWSLLDIQDHKALYTATEEIAKLTITEQLKIFQKLNDLEKAFPEGDVSILDSPSYASSIREVTSLMKTHVNLYSELWENDTRFEKIRDTLHQNHKNWQALKEKYIQELGKRMREEASKATKHIKDLEQASQAPERIGLKEKVVAQRYFLATKRHLTILSAQLPFLREEAETSQALAGLEKLVASGVVLCGNDKQLSQAMKEFKSAKLSSDANAPALLTIPDTKDILPQLKDLATEEEKSLVQKAPTLGSRPDATDVSSKLGALGDIDLQVRRSSKGKGDPESDGSKTKTVAEEPDAVYDWKSDGYDPIYDYSDSEGNIHNLKTGNIIQPAPEKVKRPSEEVQKPPKKGGPIAERLARKFREDQERAKQEEEQERAKQEEETSKTEGKVAKKKKASKKNRSRKGKDTKEPLDPVAGDVETVEKIAVEPNEEGNAERNLDELEPSIKGDLEQSDIAVVKPAGSLWEEVEHHQEEAQPVIVEPKEAVQSETQPLEEKKIENKKSSKNKNKNKKKKSKTKNANAAHGEIVAPRAMAFANWEREQTFRDPETEPAAYEESQSTKAEDIDTGIPGEPFIEQKHGENEYELSEPIRETEESSGLKDERDPEQEPVESTSAPPQEAAEKEINVRKNLRLDGLDWITVNRRTPNPKPESYVEEKLQYHYNPPTKQYRPRPAKNAIKQVPYKQKTTEGIANEELLQTQPRMLKNEYDHKKDATDQQSLLEQWPALLSVQPLVASTEEKEHQLFKDESSLRGPIPATKDLGAEAGQKSTMELLGSTAPTTEPTQEQAPANAPGGFHLDRTMPTKIISEDAPKNQPRKFGPEWGPENPWAEEILQDEVTGFDRLSQGLELDKIEGLMSKLEAAIHFYKSQNEYQKILERPQRISLLYFNVLEAAKSGLGGVGMWLDHLTARMAPFENQPGYSGPNANAQFRKLNQRLRAATEEYARMSENVAKEVERLNIEFATHSTTKMRQLGDDIVDAVVEHADGVAKAQRYADISLGFLRYQQGKVASKAPSTGSIKDMILSVQSQADASLRDQEILEQIRQLALQLGNKGQNE